MDDPIKVEKTYKVQVVGQNGTVELTGKVEQIDHKRLLLIIHVDNEFESVADKNGMFKVHINKVRVVFKKHTQKAYV